MNALNKRKTDVRMDYKFDDHEPVLRVSTLGETKIIDENELDGNWELAVQDYRRESRFWEMAFWIFWIFLLIVSSGFIIGSLIT